MGKFNFDIVKNPEIFQENRLAAHSDHEYYANMADAEIGESSYKYLLNGIWKFSYAKNYASTIPGFEKIDYDCHVWDNIRVPAHIQMEGYDIPQYANTQFPWEGHENIRPGEIPSVFNPVGSYVKYFEVPAVVLGAGTRPALAPVPDFPKYFHQIPALHAMQSGECEVIFETRIF